MTKLLKPKLLFPTLTKESKINHKTDKTDGTNVKKLLKLIKKEEPKG